MSEDILKQIEEVMAPEVAENVTAEDSSKTETTEELVVTEYTDIEKEAIEQGWVPPEKFKGPKEEAVSAEVFVARGPLMSQLKKQKKELEEIKATMLKFKEQFSKAEEIAYKKALKEVEAKMEAAVFNSDLQGVKQAQKEMESLQKPEVKTQEGPDPLVQQFIETHTWFSNPQTDEEFLMRSLAQGASTRFAQTRTGTVQDELDYVLEAVKTQFPTRFKAPGKQKNDSHIAEATPVSVSNTQKKVANTSGKPKDWDSLPEDVRTLATDLVRAGVYKSESEYVTELRKVRGI